MRLDHLLSKEQPLPTPTGVRDKGTPSRQHTSVQGCSMAETPTTATSGGGLDQYCCACGVTRRRCGTRESRSRGGVLASCWVLKEQPPGGAGSPVWVPVWLLFRACCFFHQTAVPVWPVGRVGVVCGGVWGGWGLLFEFCIVDASIFLLVKFVRANGGCLGMGSR